LTNARAFRDRLMASSCIAELVHEYRFSRERYLEQ
jgi:hypothetical protein